MKVYRADKRRFEVGDTARTARDFPSLNPDGMQLETLFAETKPDQKPVRTDCLFVFENYADAEWHWAKMAGGILYECEIAHTAILHRGDMRLVDSAGEALRAGGDAKASAHQYWAGTGTEHPRWELLVLESIVTDVICDDQKLRIARAVHGQRLPARRSS